MKTGPTWTLATLNLNGLRSAVRKGFHDWRKRSRADVICLQELRMNREQVAAMPGHAPPRGWTVVQADAEKKGYAGTAVWTRLPVRGHAVGCGIERADREGRMVRVDLDEATVVSLYVPSGSSGPERQAWKEAFLERFLDVSRELLELGRPVALCGDINIAHREIDIHNPRGNAKNSGFLPHERAWVDRLLAQGWVDLFRHLHPEAREYSWWSNRGRARELDRGWRIDAILVTPDLAERAEDCWIVGRTPRLSDHAPVMARFRR